MAEIWKCVFISAKYKGFDTKSHSKSWILKTIRLSTLDCGFKKFYQRFWSYPSF